MTKCILCLERAAAFSAEHVFPEAIGGSLTIDCVCDTCNHRMGSRVDALLADHWAIQVRRRQLNLRGKGGKLPNPRLVASVEGCPGVKIALDYGRDEVLGARIQNPVVTDEHGNRSIYALDSELDRMPHILNTIQERMGSSNVGARLPTSVKSFPNPKLRGEVPIDTHGYRRALIKIAYQLAHRWLGESYLLDPTAIVLRSILTQADFSPEDFLNSTLVAQIYLSGELVPGTSSVHFAGLFHGGDKLGICVQIFDLFRAEIVVTHDAARYPKTVDHAILLDAVSATYDEGSMATVLGKLLSRARAHRGEGG